MNTPKPAPPRRDPVIPEQEQGQFDKHIDEFVFSSGQTVARDLPPINLKSPDGLRVVEVRDPEKAKSMTSKGWTLTQDKKTPYVPQPHLTNRPFQNEDLAALRRKMEPAVSRPIKKNIKEKK